MAINPALVKAGDILYDYHSERMGNTTMRTMGNWPVEVVSIDHEDRSAVVRWNYNPPKNVSYRYIAKLRRSPGPEKMR